MNFINKVIIVFVTLIFLVFLIITSKPITPSAKPKLTSSSMSLKSYIITLKESASEADVSHVKEQISKLGGVVTTEYSLIKGFAAKLPQIHAESIKSEAHVSSIEEDQEVKIN